jgi:hypothetical protein
MHWFMYGQLIAVQIQDHWTEIEEIEAINDNNENIGIAIV